MASRNLLSLWESLRGKASQGLREILKHWRSPNAKPVRRFFQFWEWAVRSFLANRCPSRAAGLAYTTLLALIPMLAFGVSVSTSLLKNEGEKIIEDLIDRAVAKVAPQLDLMPIPGSQSAEAEDEGEDEDADKDENPETVEVQGNASSPSPAGPAESSEPAQALESNDTADNNQNPTPAGDEEEAAIDSQRKEVVRKIMEYIDNVQSGALGASSIIILLLVAISMLRNVEFSFNDIWGVSTGRSWLTSIVHYWAFISLGPLILAALIGSRTALKIDDVQAWLTERPFGGILIYCVPLVLVLLSFTFLYQYMPNTRVQWRAAFVGALVSFILLYANSSLNVMLYDNQVISYTNIYGSLVTIPLFLVGLYVSWLMVLFGAQVAYTFQNRNSYLKEDELQSLNPMENECLAIHVMTAIAEAFHRGGKAPGVSQLAESLNIPTRRLYRILTPLQDYGLVYESSGENPGYIPAKPTDSIMLHDILQAFRNNEKKSHEDIDQVHPQVVEHYSEILKAERDIASRFSLQDIIHESPQTVKKQKHAEKRPKV